MSLLTNPPLTHALVDNRQDWTIEDLEQLATDPGHHYEIIDGALIVTRAPHLKHQNIVGNLYSELHLWSKISQLGRPIFAPGLVLSPQRAVIPDLVWASNAHLAQHTDTAGHFTAAPELIVEVLSPTAADQKRDRQTKLALYSEEGVLEYWLVDRNLQTLEIYRQVNGTLQPIATLKPGNSLTSPLLPNFTCAIATIFI